MLVWGDHLHSLDEAIRHCQSLVDAGKEFVIEEKLVGQEFSLISFADGKILSICQQSKIISVPMKVTKVLIPVVWVLILMLIIVYRFISC